MIEYLNQSVLLWQALLMCVVSTILALAWTDFRAWRRRKRIGKPRIIVARDDES